MINIFKEVNNHLFINQNIFCKIKYKMSLKHTKSAPGISIHHFLWKTIKKKTIGPRSSNVVVGNLLVEAATNGSRNHGKGCNNTRKLFHFTAVLLTNRPLLASLNMFLLPVLPRYSPGDKELCTAVVFYVRPTIARFFF